MIGLLKLTWMIGLLKLTVMRPDLQTGDELLWDLAMTDRFGLRRARMSGKWELLRVYHPCFECSDSRSYDW
jgi:hypothetical protein